MFTLYHVYQSLENKRKRVLELFEKVDENHLYYVAKPNTWSPEMLFRHLLSSLYFLSKCLPGEPINLHELAITGGPTKNDEYKRKTTLHEISEALNETSAIISQRLKELTPEMGEEVIEMWNEKHPRQDMILMFIGHDHAHLGQIIWLYKRSTEEAPS